MLELIRDADRWRLGYAGDTFNTALYLSRLGVPTAFMTALGTDPFSQELRGEWLADGLDTSLVLSDAARLPGLYAVRNDADGERHFYYWRNQSAARQLFTLPGIAAALARVRATRQLYLSGITLSLFSASERTTLRELAEAVRAAGGEVIFDPNYREKGWNSAEEARAAIRALAPCVSLALPTFTDEAALCADASPAHTAARWREWGVQEVIVKLGAQGCLVSTPDGTVTAAAVKVRKVIDTTAAGDAFNAGFIAARRAGRTPLEAAAAANRIAALVIQHPGAILPRDNTAQLRAALAS
jgi:2-dehydro-3-deoxygluconokinase